MVYQEGKKIGHSQPLIPDVFPPKIVAGFEPPTSQHHTCPIFHYLQVKRERVTESCTKTDKQNGMNVNGAAAKIYVSRIPSKK